MNSNFKPSVAYIVTLLVFLNSANAAKVCQQTDHQPIIPPKPRLQMDLAPGSPDLQWSRDAKKTVDQRLGWWREARLGCFIHWNDASLLGSEWKGKQYLSLIHI